MLLELRAENYAVIDHAIAAFGPGLNLLTGETGAGKSILVDALALLMGDKASSDVVRHGAEKAVVACVFESTAGAESILHENGIDADSPEIILRREIQVNGKGRVYVNNQPATVAVLRLLAPELALVHAQSETSGAFDSGQQRALLDRFAGISTQAAAAAYSAWRDVQKQLQELEEDEQDRLRMADMWSFQSKEIFLARLVVDEDEALDAERRVLANAEKLQVAATAAYEQLYESSESAETALRSALKNVEEIIRYDPELTDAAQQLTSVRAIVNDVSATIRDYSARIEASPERLAEIEDRLALLDRLKRKYGPTLKDVILFGNEVAAKLAEIENRDEILKGLRLQLAQAAEEYRHAAENLTQQRTAAAKKLEKLAEVQINDLAMKARFSVVVKPDRAEAALPANGPSVNSPSANSPAANSQVTNSRRANSWTANGWDAVECLIATNPGEPLKPLDEIASGGEMSRVLLALKVSVEEGASRGQSTGKSVVPRTLVFDEIDIGIGGRAAEAVGQKLKALSRSQQVLCVTHLPQIAAFADQHFLIEKREQQGRTKTSVQLLDEVTRTEEVARMLSGAKLTETSMRHAEQMVAAARSVETAR